MVPPQFTAKMRPRQANMPKHDNVCNTAQPTKIFLFSLQLKDVFHKRPILPCTCRKLSVMGGFTTSSFHRHWVYYNEPPQFCQVLFAFRSISSALFICRSVITIPPIILANSCLRPSKSKGMMVVKVLFSFTFLVISK